MVKLSDCLEPTLFFVGTRRRWRARTALLGPLSSIGGIGSVRATVRSCMAMVSWSVELGIGMVQHWGKNDIVFEIRICCVFGMVHSRPNV